MLQLAERPLPAERLFPSPVFPVLPEEELVEGLCSQRRSVLNTLYSMYAPTLYGIVFRIIKREELAEEALQDTFVRIWNSSHFYSNKKGRLFTWMSTIARNVAIDYVRLKSSRNDLLKQELPVEGLLEDTFKVLYNPEAIGLKHLSEQLRPEQKIVVDLIYFNGYTHSEVAEELNIPIGTVKTRLRMAINNLRKLFN